MSIPGSICPLFLAEEAEISEIPKAVLFNQVNFLERTVTSSGSQTKFTFSAWVKAHKDDTPDNPLPSGLFCAGEPLKAGYTALDFNEGKLRFTITGGYESGQNYCETANVYADHSAFYHVHIRVDTTLASAADRVQIYVNGKRAFIIDPAEHFIKQNFVTSMNLKDEKMRVGASFVSLNGEPAVLSAGMLTMSAVDLLDGRYQDPTRFGRFNENNGMWQARPGGYKGPYGRNGARLLDFKRSSVIGKDTSVASSAYTPVDFTFVNNDELDSNGHWIQQISVASGNRDRSDAEGVPDIFDGNENIPGANPSGSSATWTFPTGGLAIESSFKVRITGGANTPSVRFHWGDLETQQYDYQPVVGDPETVDIFPFIQSPLTKVTWTSDADGPFFYNFEVDGETLVDDVHRSTYVVSDSPSDGTLSNDTGDGGQLPSNYCSWNIVDHYVSEKVFLENGNREAYLVNKTGSQPVCRGTTPHLTSGKWYWEVIFFKGEAGLIGISDSTKQASFVSNGEHTLTLRVKDGDLAGNLVSVDSSYAASALDRYDVVGVALDMDNGNLVFYINGSPLGTANETPGSLQGKSVIPHLGRTNENSGTFEVSANFGEREFVYNAPPNYKTVCSAHLPSLSVEVPRKHFAPKEYEGAGDGQELTGFKFTPSLLWFKNIFGIYTWRMVNARSGPGKDFELKFFPEDEDDRSVTAFLEDGVRFGQNNPSLNYPRYAYIAYAWDAGQGPDVTNTDGDITSSVRVNSVAGISMFRYEGNGLNNQKVGHGLTSAPGLFWVKDINDVGYFETWSTGIVDDDNSGDVRTMRLGYGDKPGKYLYDGLNVPPVTNECIYVSPEIPPFSRLHSLNAAGHEYMACCFQAIKGFSSFGYFNMELTEDLPYVQLDFRPAVVILKSQGGDPAFPVPNWFIYDNQRRGYNDSNFRLIIGDKAVENRFKTIRFLSNGFQIIGEKNDDPKLEPDNYLYIAFAENPFKRNGGITG